MSGNQEEVEFEVGSISDHTDPRYSSQARYRYILHSLWGNPDGSGGRWNYEDASSAAHDRVAQEWNQTKEATAWHALTGE